MNFENAASNEFSSHRGSALKYSIPNSTVLARLSIKSMYLTFV